MTFAVSQLITTLCRCCVTVLERCFTATSYIFAAWLGARCVCELFRRARWRRPRTMPFPTEFAAAPNITREVDSEGRLISRMKQYDENDPSPRNLREWYRNRRRRERASGTVSCSCSRRATFGQPMAMVALVALAVALCASTVSATAPVDDDAPSYLVHTLARRALQTAAITDANIKVAADACKTESSDYNCPTSQATYGPVSTWDTSSVTRMDQSTCMGVAQACFVLWPRLAVMADASAHIAGIWR
eukprot:COSAG06_NODE_14382_length_1161_cov_1.625235_1_plen_247_part_00